MSLAVDLIIDNCKFYKGLAQNGGAIFMSGLSDLQIKNSLFKDNCAKTFGGAIYGSGFTSIEIEST